MTPNEARAEVANLAASLLDANLAISINTPAVFNLGNIARVTWPASMNSSGTLSALPFGSILEYRQLVLGNQYTALLNDGALLQISMDLSQNNIVGHRMCYYPCPVIVPPDLDIAEFDQLDLLFLEEFSAHEQLIGSGTTPSHVALRLRSPVRFDYAPHAATQSEPASHVHVINEDTRIPVHAAISVGHFVQFVFKHFYPEQWANRDLDGLTRWPLRQQDRAIIEDDERGLHFDCRHPLGATS